MNQSSDINKEFQSKVSEEKQQNVLKNMQELENKINSKLQEMDNLFSGVASDKKKSPLVQAALNQLEINP